MKKTLRAASQSVAVVGAAVVASSFLEVLEELPLEHQSVGAAYLRVLVAVAVDLQ